jgi:hypothetical protein
MMKRKKDKKNLIRIIQILYLVKIIKDKANPALLAVKMPQI